MKFETGYSWNTLDTIRKLVTEMSDIAPFKLTHCTRCFQHIFSNDLKGLADLQDVAARYWRDVLLLHHVLIYKTAVF